MNRIPATIVTGFLGAGKTTLLRHLVETADGARLAFLINEFGALGIDRELLLGCADCKPGDVIELANGCICCEVADDFLPTIEKLLDRPDPPDHIVIETSGLALPKPLLKAFAWAPIRTRATVDGVIAVIDAEAFAADRFNPDQVRPGDHDNPLEEVFADQLNAADLVILNKIDLIDPATRRALESRLAAMIRPGAKIIATEGSRLAAKIALGLEAEAEADLATRPSHIDAAGEHDHDDFDSFAITPPAVAPDELTRRLGAAIAAHDILRVKGFLDVPGKPMRLALQAVGPRITTYFDRPWRVGEARAHQLVVIGRKPLDRAAIEAALA